MEEIENNFTEILPEEAKKYSKNALVGDIVEIPLETKQFGRIAATTANVRDNIRSSPHTCRHYFAQCQLRNGIDVYSLSRLMGHNNIKITQRYLSSLNDSDIVEKSVKTSPLMRIM